MFNPVRSQIAAMQPKRFQSPPPVGGAGFNAYAAGKKTYGQGRPAPTYGAVSKPGYAMRDGKAAARREALIRRAGSR